MNNDVERDVRCFLASELAVSPGTIQLDSTLMGDLGINGDDAVEFFESFSTRFWVDLGDLRLRRHFLGEGDYAWLPFWYLIFLLRKLFRWQREPSIEASLGLVPITVSDLVAAARGGSWRVVKEKATSTREAHGPFSPDRDGERSGKAASRTPDMQAGGHSDDFIVPKKRANDARSEHTR